jgi:orotidine-5'-phosphate decarboxylase
MFAFNPGVNDRSGEILGAAGVNAANTTAQANVGLVNDIGGALMGLASSYAGNRAMKAEAEGYDKIGEILGSSMFKDNPAVGGYLADLRKQKDPQAKIAGYNALFGLAGPMSNAMMAQRNAGIREDQQMMNSPGARAAIGNQTAITNQGGNSRTGATRRF